MSKKKPTLTIGINSLATDDTAIKREAVQRRSPFFFESISQNDVALYAESGWELDKLLKTRAKVKKRKPHDKVLEDKFWWLLFKMGYTELNVGYQFKISYERHGASNGEKQIDVFARDQETVIVAECKSSARMGRRSLQKDIHEFDSLKGPIANTINKQYVDSGKLKILWFFVTENVSWSDEDRERAKAANIRIITENELPYFLQIAEHLGSAARYQFLAEYLSNQEVPALRNRTVPAIKGKLGGRDFFSFVVTAEDLLKLSFINHRSLRDPEGAPSYQRLVKRARMAEIGKFIENGGYFPTNILVNFRESPRFDSNKRDEETGVSFGSLYLPSKYRSIWVIDGQHRLYGFANLSDKYRKQNLVVIGFSGLQPEEEANLFVTINHEQKTVPKTLLDDLEGELKWGSDKPLERIGAISARLVDLLNLSIGGPLYDRVARQGLKENNRTCLTLPAIKDGIKRSGLVGTAAIKRQVYQPGPFSGKDDSDTLRRSLKGIEEFFNRVYDANREIWDAGREGFVCTNVGVQAYLVLLGELVKYMETNKGYDAKDLDAAEIIEEADTYFEPLIKYLKGSTLQSIEQDFRVPYGATGPREYFFRLARLVHNEFSDFTPPGFQEWLLSQSEERTELADTKLKKIAIIVQSAIFSKLKEIHGTENANYWEIGVPDNIMKTKAYSKSLDDEQQNRGPLESYLEFVDYKTIVAHKDNWPYFESFFAIPEPGEKRHGKNLEWMLRVNKLRRIPAHPTETRRYTSDDFEYIDYIHGELTARLQKSSTMHERP